MTSVNTTTDSERAYQAHHVVSLENVVTLHCPPSCTLGTDCPVRAAAAEVKPEMRAIGGRWTCEVRDGSLLLLSRIGD